MRKHIQKHADHSFSFILKRTVSAQLHFLGSVMAVVGLFVLLYFVLQKSNLEHFIANLIFGITGVLVFGSSTLYHFCVDGYVVTPELRKWLKDFDHFSIYLFGFHYFMILNFYI